jgi:hypothetical protein
MKNKNQYLREIIVFNATFNTISAILWWSVLLAEETGVPGENHAINIYIEGLSHVISCFVISISTPMPK